jgi:sugar O-acyltransferase (sialic acid O-acetyltransferase NeuD family)
MSVLFLCGAGNSEGVRLAINVERAAHRWDRIVLLDDDPAKAGRDLLGVPIVGPTSMLAGADTATDEIVNLVTRTCDRREVLHRRLSAFGIPFATLIHPAVDTLGATLAAGTTVYAGATIGPEAVVDSGSVVFMGAVIGHEARVGRGCVVAANAVLNARVRLCDRVYVGANATLIPEVSVGADATVGVGSAVLQDIPAGATALGVPAEILDAHLAAISASHEAPAGRRAPVDVDVYRAVAQAWQEVLSIDHITGDENFFDIGGTSILAAQLAERTRAATGKKVGLVEIFQFPTVRTLAEHLTPNRADWEALSAPALRAEQRRRFWSARAMAR